MQKKKRKKKRKKSAQEERTRTQMDNGPSVDGPLYTGLYS